MINGELIVDNFAGVVRGRTYTKLENWRRTERTVTVLVILWRRTMIRKVRNVKIGQTITSTDFGGEKTDTYKVIAIYPFHVLTKNAIGIKRCFSYGHLVQMGLER